MLLSINTNVLVLLLLSTVFSVLVTSHQGPRIPLIISHRGFSGVRPEHSLAAYEAAIQAGSDAIEQDVVVSKDGELIVFHDRNLDGTILEEDLAIYNQTEKRKLDEIRTESGERSTKPLEKSWWVEDFTLQQLKQMKLKQRYPFRNQLFNGLFGIVTLREALQFLDGRSKELGRHFAPYIELKSPTYFKSIGLQMEDKFLEVLVEFDYIRRIEGQKKYTTNPDKPFYIQCFELSTLLYFSDLIENSLLVQLIKENLNIIQPDRPTQIYRDLVSKEGLEMLSQSCSGIGPHKSHIIEFDEAQKWIHHDLVDRAHENGLIVHPYTFRDDYPKFFKQEWGMKYPEDEFIMFFKAGVDGVFTDFPSTGRRAVDIYLTQQTMENASTHPAYSVSRKTTLVIVSLIALVSFVIAFSVFAIIFFSSIRKKNEEIAQQNAVSVEIVPSAAENVDMKSVVYPREEKKNRVRIDARGGPSRRSSTKHR